MCFLGLSQFDHLGDPFGSGYGACPDESREARLLTHWRTMSSAKFQTGTFVVLKK